MSTEPNPPLRQVITVEWHPAGGAQIRIGVTEHHLADEDVASLWLLLTNYRAKRYRRLLDHYDQEAAG